MIWRGARQSSNVEDRRSGGKRMMVGGGLGSIVFIILAIFFGVDPSGLLQEANSPDDFVTSTHTSSRGPNGAAAEDVDGQFASTVLAYTEDVWTQLFHTMGKTYEEPNLVLFRDQTHSACGFADAAVGPFYCPSDSKVYVDLGFFDELDRRFKAPGDFAQAYVIAHEVGHHVQNLLGTTRQVQSMRGKLSEKDYNALSVRLELQADFYAGVWAHHAHKARAILEQGDVEEALRAASAIGDDNIQRRAKGFVVPDSFTHGTSEQRLRWFRKGLQTGDINQGDTFGAAAP